MNANERQKRPPILPLTSLRFVAAAGVVFYHLLPKTAQTPTVVANVLGMAGSVAVSFFFVLSGFILMYSDVTDEGVMRKSRAAFWWTRFGRIYPVYLLAFILAGPATYLGLAKHGAWGAFERMLLYGVAAATLLQSWTPFTAGSWNAPGWSLSVEAFFYLLFPWLMRMSRLRDATLGRILALLWLLASAPSIGLQWYYHDSSLVPELVLKFWNDTPLLRVPEFAAGMILAIFWVRHRDRPSTVGHASPLPLLSIFLAIAIYLCFFPGWLQHIVLLPLFLMLIFRCATDRSGVSRWLSHSILVRLGEASYAIYILHIPLFVYWHSWLQPKSVNATFVLNFLAGVTLISLGIYAWLEKPVARWVRNRFANVAGEEPSTDRARIAHAESLLETNDRVSY